MSQSGSTNASPSFMPVSELESGPEDDDALPPVLEIERTAAYSRVTALEHQLEAVAWGILDLTAGYPDGLDPEWVRAIQGSVHPDLLDGCRPHALKTSIAAYFERLLQWDHVEITNSASEALFFAIDSTIEAPGDEIMLFQGGFDTYAGLIQSCAGRPVFVPRQVDGRPGIEELERRITPRTRAIILTQPENPLGLINSVEELVSLVRLALRHRLALIVDHAFLEVSPFGRPVPTLTGLGLELRAAGLRFLMIGDTGKILSLHGMRLGVIACSDHFRSTLAHKISNLFFRIDTARLYVIATLLTHPRIEEHKRQLNARLAANYSMLIHGLDPRIKVAPVGATAMALLEISALGMTDVEFAERLLEAERVALIPASYFFQGVSRTAAPGNLVRIAFSRDEATIREALVRINRFVAGLP